MIPRTALGPVVLAVGGVVVAALGVLTLSSRQSDVAGAAVMPPTVSLTPVARIASRPPAYLHGVADPVFGSTVTRISDNRAFGTTGMWLRHSHAKVQPWNSDGSRLLLGYTDPGFLLDGHTYEFTGETLAGASRGVWSNTDPDTFYSVDANRLVRTSVRDGRSVTARTFSSWDAIGIGRGEGSPSNDDRTIALIATKSDRTAVISYDLLEDEVLGVLELPPGAGPGLEWAAASQSGDYVVLNWTDDGLGPGRGVDVHDRALRFVRDLAEVSEQGDLCYDADGYEVYVTFDPATGKLQGDQQRIVALRLADRAVRLLLRTDWVGTHVSCRNLDRPGWCYVSDAAADTPNARTGGFDEIFALKLDGSQAVQRFSHAQLSAGVPYDWTTLAVPSRDGTRVLWASDWGSGSASPAYAYVASYADPAGEHR